MKEESVHTVEQIKHHCGEMDHKALRCVCTTVPLAV
jgi:hypothetical protein